MTREEYEDWADDEITRDYREERERREEEIRRAYRDAYGNLESKI